MDFRRNSIFFVYGEEMEGRKAYSADGRTYKKSNKTLADLKTYLNTFEDWILGIESTKTLYIKSKKMRGISISITVDYSLIDNNKIDYRLISLVKTNVNKPNNRVFHPEELAVINKTINLIRKFLS